MEHWGRILAILAGVASSGCGDSQGDEGTAQTSATGTSTDASTTASMDETAATSGGRSSTSSAEETATPSTTTNATNADTSTSAIPTTGTGTDTGSVDPSCIWHQTSFLLPYFTHTYGGQDAGVRQQMRDAITSREYTHFYLYIYNENDYGGPSFDYYADPDGFNGLLQELLDDGLRPVVWLFPDDAPNVAGTSIEELQARLSTVIPQIDDRVSEYVLCLECDEYWPEDKVNALGSHLDTLTDKPIGVHMLPDNTFMCDDEAWCDYLALQTGFGQTPEQVGQDVQNAIAALEPYGKVVVAAEYEVENEANGITLGNAAVAAGAAGFGNGATPVAPSGVCGD